MRSVWSSDTSSRSPSSCSASSCTLVAGESSTTWPFREGSRGSSNPTPGDPADRKCCQGWHLWDKSTLNVTLDFQHTILPVTLDFLPTPFSHPACGRKANTKQAGWIQYERINEGISDRMYYLYSVSLRQNKESEHGVNLSAVAFLGVLPGGFLCQINDSILSLPSLGVR